MFRTSAVGLDFTMYRFMAFITANTMSGITWVLSVYGASKAVTDLPANLVGVVIRLPFSM